MTTSATRSRLLAAACAAALSGGALLAACSDDDSDGQAEQAAETTAETVPTGDTDASATTDVAADEPTATTEAAAPDTTSATTIDVDMDGTIPGDDLDDWDEGWDEFSRFFMAMFGLTRENIECLDRHGAFDDDLEVDEFDPDLFDECGLFEWLEAMTGLERDEVECLAADERSDEIDIFEDLLPGVFDDLVDDQQVSTPEPSPEVAELLADCGIDPDRLAADHDPEPMFTRILMAVFDIGADDAACLVDDLDLEDLSVIDADGSGDGEEELEAALAACGIELPDDPFGFED